MSDIPTIHEPKKDSSPSVTLPDPGHPANAPTEQTDSARSRTYVVAAGQRFGEYEILGEIARGGMGVVYRARQTALDRIVALKMILAGRLANADEVQRFRTEAEAAARLQHPNLVTVHEVDEIDGQHFFTMEFIEGMSLDQRLIQGPLAGKPAARYVRILARAVHYAHKQGILHRDLKPSNVLIDADDEPHITDFGLAKRLGEGGSGKTRTGAVLGTPSYMSPEQAQGKTAEIGPAADIYSLGAILYELVTGRPPFRAETPLDTVMQVIDQEPVPPRLLNANVEHDLETICLKCLTKDPHQRYASAEELGEDLQRYLDGDSIHARSLNMFDRLAHVLERDTHTADFSTWSSMVLIVAAAVFVEHFAVFCLVKLEQPNWLLLGARVLLFVTLGFLFWRHRGERLLPTSAAERELWTIWIGYFTTYFFIVIVIRLLTYFEIAQPHPDWEARRYFRDLLPYPFIALVSGLAFFIMGSNYWGRCYAIGGVFFLAAALMPLDLTFGPLIFGTLWGITLLTLGLHLRKQAAVLEEKRAPTAVLLSQAATVNYRDASPG
ncbi:MAG: serine/threonine protein kinase [Planctomycetes bacterium]|nr:serine/threonine protein kinase [Planctomycetota bacterium]